MSKKLLAKLLAKKGCALRPAVTWRDRIQGLIGAPKNQAIYFQTRWGIHTFFMSFPIDVLVLDKHSKVKIIKPNLVPNQIFFYNPSYCLVVEMPAGMISELNISQNDKIILDV